MLCFLEVQGFLEVQVYRQRLGAPRTNLGRPPPLEKAVGAWPTRQRLSKPRFSRPDMAYLAGTIPTAA
jgi:hypothetical protein